MMAALLTKRRLSALALAAALTLTLSAGTLVADALGQPVTPAAHACNNGSASGGGC